MHSVDSFSYCRHFYLLFCLEKQFCISKTLKTPKGGRGLWVRGKKRWKKGNNKQQMTEREKLQHWKYRARKLEEDMKQRNPDITHHFLKVNQGAGGCFSVMLCLEMWEDDEMNIYRFHCHLHPASFFWWHEQPTGPGSCWWGDPATWKGLG